MLTEKWEQVLEKAKKILEKFVEIDWLMNKELEGVIWVTKKRFWEASNKSLS
jgi:hypothetical protein